MESLCCNAHSNMCLYLFIFCLMVCIDCWMLRNAWLRSLRCRVFSSFFLIISVIPTRIRAVFEIESLLILMFSSLCWRWWIIASSASLRFCNFSSILLSCLLSSYFINVTIKNIGGYIYRKNSFSIAVSF